MPGKIKRVIALTTAFLLLSGCFFRSPEDLYAVPKAPQDFENLQNRIDEVINAGAEYAGPQTGNFTQTVQLRDLDGDGVQEAIAFFRLTGQAANAAGGGKPLQIYIYRQQPDDTFGVQAVIEWSGIDGSSINSIAYEDLDGDGAEELVVSWQYTNKTYQLMAYSVKGETVSELMQVSYTDYAIIDLDKDNLKEIMVFNVDTVESTYQADLYDYSQEQHRMVLKDTAPMSKEIVSMADTKAKLGGYLKNYEPALYVTYNVSTGYLTDIFVWRDGRLVNITLNPESGISEQTYRLTNNVGLKDINGDAVLEVPRPMAFSAPRQLDNAVDKKPDGSDTFWSIQWVQYDIEGKVWPVYTTYYNHEDGWYLVLPDAWLNLIVPDATGEKITLSRRDTTSGERAVVFSLWDGSEMSDAAPFLTFYKLTGPNRVTRSKLGNRFILTQESDAIYAAEFTPGGWDCGVTAEALATSFHFIPPDLS